MEQELGDDTDSFYMDVKEKAFSIGLSLDTVKSSSKGELKVILKKLINISMVKSVTQSLNMSKLRFVNRPETFSRKKYILEMNGFFAIQVIKTRLNMLPVYGNFKGDLTLRRLCKWCDEEDDTTEHFLTCKVMGTWNIKPEQLRNDDSPELWKQINNVVEANIAGRGLETKCATV